MFLRSICLIFVITPALLGAEDWTSWRGPRLNGKAKATDFPATQRLEVEWSRDIGSGYSGIVVAGDDAVTMFSDGTSDYLGRFSVADGAARWRVRLSEAYRGRHGSEDGPSSTPCIANGIVFAATAHGQLTAHSMGDGTELWRVDFAKRFDAKVPWYGFGASPVVIEGVLFLPFGSQSGIAGAAFSPDTGALLWTIEGGPVDYQYATRLDGIEALVTADTRELRFVDLRTGDITLRHAFGTDERDLAYPQLVPVARNRLLLAFADRATLYEIDPAAKSLATELWTTRQLKDSYAPPIAHGGAIFGLSGIFLVAIDASSGDLLWKSRAPGARALSFVDDSLVLLATNGDVVIAEADRDGYRETGRTNALERGGYTNPTIVGDRIFVRNTQALSVLRVHPAEGLETGPVAEHPKGTFRALLGRLASAQQPQEQLDAWWDEQRDRPIIDGDSVTFVYRGDADQVAIIGDMTADRTVPEPMTPVPKTDLFYRAYSFPDGARWQYAFLVDLAQTQIDPENDIVASPIAAISGNPRSLGYPEPSRESVVATDIEDPPFLRPIELKGRLEALEISSPSMRTPRELQVWLPPGYSSGQHRYPTLYVLGGHGWLAQTPIVNGLERLMGTTCEPAIVVFVPYHSGSADRMGAESYVRLIDRTVAPLIEEQFRTDGRRVALGAADDAVPALALGFKDEGRYQRVAGLSPYADAEDLELLKSAKGKPQRLYLEWSRYEPRVLDVNSDARETARALQRWFKAHGLRPVGGEIVPGPGWGSWVRRLDRVLQLLLPIRPEPAVVDGNERESGD